jgi:hypothetical protein
MAGAGDSLFALKMPATKVPCRHAALLALAHAAPAFAEIWRTFSVARSGWSMATGPSTKPIRISGRPLVTAIKDGSFTKSNGLRSGFLNCNL